MRGRATSSLASLPGLPPLAPCSVCRSNAAGTSLTSGTYSHSAATCGMRMLVLLSMFDGSVLLVMSFHLNRAAAVETDHLTACLGNERPEAATAPGAGSGPGNDLRFCQPIHRGLHMAPLHPGRGAISLELAMASQNRIERARPFVIAP